MVFLYVSQLTIRRNVCIYSRYVLDIYLYVPNKYNKFKVLISLQNFANFRLTILIAKVRATVNATSYHEWTYHEAYLD